VSTGWRTRNALFQRYHSSVRQSQNAAITAGIFAVIQGFVCAHNGAMQGIMRHNLERPTVIALPFAPFQGKLPVYKATSPISFQSTAPPPALKHAKCNLL
jgi:hypothetical protein